MPQIHPTSVIGKSADIAENVEIGAYCIIEDDVKIGEGTKLLNNVSVYSGTRIGVNNTISPGAVLGGFPQDLKFVNEFTELFIGDNNIIREYVTMNRGTHATRKTTVGNKNLFMAYSHVAHDCSIGNNCILANSVALGGHVKIEDYVILGGLTGIHQFVKIGMHSMIGAASMVVKDVIPYALFSGNPLAYEGMNIIGLRRRGFSDNAIDNIKLAYKFLFASGMNVSQAAEKIKNSVSQTDEVKYLLTFISSSKRGIAK